MSQIDPAGPIFLSHRHSDGRALAFEQARCLRASGIPVWLDKDDLPPGDTAQRLEEALDHGLAGGILTVTPEVAASAAIRTIEAPRLLALAADPRFTLAVVNEVAGPDGAPDRGAPSRLTGLATSIDAVSQFSTQDPDNPSSDLGRRLARTRLRLLREGRDDDVLRVDMQTRRMASAYASDADLVFRTTPPSVGSRLPDDAVWEDLGRLLAWLPDVLAGTRAPEIRFTGGGHLTIACAIGAGLPVTTGLRVTAVDLRGDWWQVPHGVPGGVLPDDVLVTGRGLDGIAVAVDLNPTDAPYDSFSGHLAAHPNTFMAAYRLERRTFLGADDGPRLVAEMGTAIRTLAARHQTQTIHLFLRTPWVAALLLGTLLNTLRVCLYEWDNSTDPPVYTRTTTVASGIGGGPMIRQP
jgi:SMODS-associated and fused to various effectors sensor domain/TIR domain